MELGPERPSAPTTGTVPADPRSAVIPAALTAAASDEAAWRRLLGDCRAGGGRDGPRDAGRRSAVPADAGNRVPAARVSAGGGHTGRARASRAASWREATPSFASTVET
jgi:hypothetical protein